MRTDKHSIGPWSLRRDRNGEECGAVLDRAGQLVATTGYRASPVDNCAEDDANARLIACAPEMLDALRSICFMTSENSGDVLKRARALIEKATRSSPKCTCPGTFYPEPGCHLSGCPVSNS